jgi:hypothetical protein
MDSEVVIRVAVFALITLAIPVAVGMCSYLWSMDKNKYIKASTLLVAPAVFFLASTSYWKYQAKGIVDAGGYPCGAFGAGAAFTTIYGTAFHFLLGAALFTLTLFLWNRRQRIQKASK